MVASFFHLGLDKPWFIKRNTINAAMKLVAAVFTGRSARSSPQQHARTKILFATDSCLMYRLRSMNEKSKLTTKPDMETIAIVRS